MADDSKDGWATFSSVLGWMAFVFWSVSFYPQVYTNWKRKAVTGLSFDFELYNFLGFTFMLIYNAVFFWSALARTQYGLRQNECGEYDPGREPSVTENDIAFALHALVLTLVHLFQIGIYDRGNQKFSNFSVTQVAVFLGVSYIWAFLSASNPEIQVIDILYYCSYVKLYLTFIKYCSQLYLNWHRKSTVGWNVLNVLLDISGAILSLGQLLIDCWIADDWSSITCGGNILKFGLSLLVILFDVLFILQHYVFYRHNRADPALGEYGKVDDRAIDEDVSEHLLPRMPSTNASPIGDADYGTRHWLLNQLYAFMSQEKQPAQL